MAIGVSAEHDELARAVARFAATRCGGPDARPRLDGDDPLAPDGLPEWWAALGATGWLGLATRAATEGAPGSGVSELVVVLGELTRFLARGPLLGTAAAATLVDLGASSGRRQQLVPGLADGTRAGALAPDPGTLTLRREGDRWRLTGRVDAVADAPDAAELVLGAREPGRDALRWVAVDARDVTVASEVGIDLSRSVGRVEVDTVVEDDRLLHALKPDDVVALVSLLVGAECAGGARWCMEAAAEHARTRVQFGRSIGHFQAVKHRCADMLVSVELAEASVWQAARGFLHPDQRKADAATAASLAVDAFVENAEAAIQVLGGIGFTWEHDAHRYLRRAIAHRQLLGGAHPARLRVATEALAGARPRLDVQLPEGVEEYRGEVRVRVDSIALLDRAERRGALVDAGLLAPHLPAPWGKDATPAEQLIIEEELRRARVRRPQLHVGAWVVPALIAHGTPAQRDAWIPPTLRGDIGWCQLFSEPDAGSDLASLRTRAHRVEGGWLLTGQKVWTSLAERAELGFALARTDPDVAKHDGITCFVVDMAAPGVDVRPLREVSGRAAFNEVFLSECYVADDAVVGAVGDGWRVGRTTLDNERVSMATGSVLGHGVEGLLELVRANHIDNDAFVLDCLGSLVAEAHALAVLGLRSTIHAIAATESGVAGSVRKLVRAEHEQRVESFGVELFGPAGAAVNDQTRTWIEGYLMKRCLTIAGGTSEIQRNILAERALGLPRDDVD